MNKKDLNEREVCSPPSAPIFETHAEAVEAAIRSAIRLKTYVREK